MRESKKYELHESGVYLPKNYQIFKKPSLYDITNRQYEQYKETAEFIQWGRRNPTKFASEVFGVELMDYQTYIFMNTWTSKVAVWAMSRNGGKSALASIYLMTKSLLVPNFTAYILCGVGSQSIEMYSKLEKITKNEVLHLQHLQVFMQVKLLNLMQIKMDLFTILLHIIINCTMMHRFLL